jgi:hypothetical protein
MSFIILAAGVLIGWALSVAAIALVARNRPTALLERVVSLLFIGTSVLALVLSEIKVLTAASLLPFAGVLYLFWRQPTPDDSLKPSSAD